MEIKEIFRLEYKCTYKNGKLGFKKSDIFRSDDYESFPTSETIDEFVNQAKRLFLLERNGESWTGEFNILRIGIRKN